VPQAGLAKFPLVFSHFRATARVLAFDTVSAAGWRWMQVDDAAAKRLVFEIIRTVQLKASTAEMDYSAFQKSASRRTSSVVHRRMLL
jgi:hypothetical protein